MLQKKLGFLLEELIQAEIELNAVTQFISPLQSSPDTCCPTATRILNAMINDASQKRSMKAMEWSIAQTKDFTSKNIRRCFDKKYVHQAVRGAIGVSVV
jgi:hypothetical protein